MEALQKIIKERNYHASQLEANILRIKGKYEAIEALEQANIKEQRLIDEYDKIIALIKVMDLDLAESKPKEKQSIPSIKEDQKNASSPD